jgi:dCTP deaminase
MAYLGTADLKEILPLCIDPYNEDNIQQAAYELSLGQEAYLTDAKDGKPEVLNDSNPTIDINPGQFALLQTLEKVTIPNSKLGFISIKAGIKFKGLINVSGFHIDPGFSGHIIFSVYNAGSSVITLRHKTNYFLLFISELSTELKNEEAYSKNGHTHQNQKGIPVNYIEVLKRGELASPGVLLERIREKEKLLEKVYWAAGIAIGLLIAILIRVFYESSKLKEGIEIGLRAQTIKEEIRKRVEHMPLDSLIAHKSDSIMRSTFNEFYDSLKKVQNSNFTGTQIDSSSKQKSPSTKK